MIPGDKSPEIFKDNIPLKYKVHVLCRFRESWFKIIQPADCYATIV